MSPGDTGNCFLKTSWLPSSAKSTAFAFSDISTPSQEPPAAYMIVMAILDISAETCRGKLHLAHFVRPEVRATELQYVQIIGAFGGVMVVVAHPWNRQL